MAARTPLILAAFGWLDAEHTERLVRTAIEVARARGGRLYILHAVPADEAFSWNDRERRARLAAIRDRAIAAGVDVDVAVQHGDPAGIIQMHAATRGAELIVIGGSRERSRFRPSIAERLAAVAPAPMLVVPAELAAPATLGQRVVFSPELAPPAVAALGDAVIRLPRDRQAPEWLFLKPSDGTPVHDTTGRLTRALETRHDTEITVQLHGLRDRADRATLQLATAVGATLIVAPAPTRSGRLFGLGLRRILADAWVPVLILPRATRSAAGSRRESTDVPAYPGSGFPAPAWGGERKAA